MILIFMYYWLQGPNFHCILNILPFLNSNLSPFIIFMDYYRHQLYSPSAFNQETNYNRFVRNTVYMEAITMALGYISIQ